MQFSFLNIIYDPRLDRIERVFERLFWIKEHILIILLIIAIVILLLHFAIKAFRRESEKKKNGESLSELDFSTEEKTEDLEGDTKV